MFNKKIVCICKFLVINLDFNNLFSYVDDLYNNVHGLRTCRDFIERRG